MTVHLCTTTMGPDQVHIRKEVQEEAREIRIKDIRAITVGSPMMSGYTKSSTK